MVNKLSTYVELDVGRELDARQIQDGDLRTLLCVTSQTECGVSY